MSADTMIDRVRSADPELPKQFRYERLMSLSVRHDFYGRSGLCRDFVITPTAATQILLRNLGLVAKLRPDGFDVFYHSSRAAAIVRYLWNRRDDHQRPGHFDLPRMTSSSWDRLTLTFTLDNPLFTNFTELPFEVRPGRDCLYLSNRDASAGDGTVRLAADWQSRIPIQETQKVTFSAAYLHLPTALRVADGGAPKGGASPTALSVAGGRAPKRGDPPNARRAVFYDASGRAFLRAYRPLEKSAKKPDAAAGSPAYQEQVVKLFPPRNRPPSIGINPETNLHLDMTREPAGRYSYAITTDEFRAKPGAEKPFLYTGMDDAPLLMVDLFLDRPSDWSGGDWFPIKLRQETLPKKATEQSVVKHYVTPRDYEIHFEARETIWTYYVVLPAGSTASDSLSIEVVKAEPPRDGAPLTFVRSSTTLAGRPASVFTAERPWRLQSRSDVSLRLRGAGAYGGGSDRILLDRLPLPSAETILPPRTADGHAVSEVFVYL
jgi:hypothetical protein